MTIRNTFKQHIRARMKKTGESYSTARQFILSKKRPPLTQLPEHVDKLSVVLAQPTSRSEDLEIDLAALFDYETLPGCDLLVLPELIGGNSDPQIYQRLICELAKRLGCCVVGGSCYLPQDDRLINSGIVVNSTGEVISRYEKRRPYGSEIDSGIASGNKVGMFSIGGRSFAVLICSDLWFSDSFTNLDGVPDVILIPSFSITQRDNPSKPRQLWKHMLIARATEYAAYVGVSDWANACQFDGLSAAGVSGFANPRPDGDCFYTANKSSKFRSYELDFTRLDAFRENRASRGFLFHPSEHAAPGEGI